MMSALEYQNLHAALMQAVVKALRAGDVRQWDDIDFFLRAWRMVAAYDWPLMLSRSHLERTLRAPEIDALYELFAWVHGYRRFVELMDALARAQRLEINPKPIRKAASRMQASYLADRRNGHYWDPPVIVYEAWVVALATIEARVRKHAID